MGKDKQEGTAGLIERNVRLRRGACDELCSVTGFDAEVVHRVADAGLRSMGNPYAASAVAFHFGSGLLFGMLVFRQQQCPRPKGPFRGRDGFSSNGGVKSLA